MSNTGKAIFTISGATSIPMYSGETLLVGRPDVFGTDFRSMIEQDRPGFTERVIRNIRTYASHGAGRLREVLIDIDGSVGGPMSPGGISNRVVGLVRRGILLAYVLPAVASNEIATDGRQLGEMSGDLPDANQVNPEISIKGVSFAELKSFQDKLVYVVRKSSDYFSTDSLKEAFENAMTATVIISTVVVLAFWAASHFAAGAGFAIDAILIAIGWVMIGWGIFSAMRSLLTCLKAVKNANSIGDLDTAAEQFADALTQVGVDLLIGLLTRGAGKLRAKSSSKPDSGGGPAGAAGGSGGRTKGGSATKVSKSTNSAKDFDNSHKHAGDHNNPDLTVHYTDYNNAKLLKLKPGEQNFNTSRKIDMSNLSPEDKAVRNALRKQGRSPEDIKMLLSSSTGKNSVIRPVKDGETFYGFQSSAAPLKANDNMFWIDEKGFKDVESKFFRDGAWDRQGVKVYLALPCHNSVDTLNTGVLPKGTKGDVIDTVIGEATETLPIRDKLGRFFSRKFNTMAGGGNQVTPPPGIIVSPIGP